MMRELWAEYVVSNPQLFKTAELGVPIPERLDAIGRTSSATRSH
jgi:hypothetical protein